MKTTSLFALLCLIAIPATAHAKDVLSLFTGGWGQVPERQYGSLTLYPSCRDAGGGKAQYSLNGRLSQSKAYEVSYFFTMNSSGNAQYRYTVRANGTLPGGSIELPGPCWSQGYLIIDQVNEISNGIAIRDADVEQDYGSGKIVPSGEAHSSNPATRATERSI